MRIRSLFCFLSGLALMAGAGPLLASDSTEGRATGEEITLSYRTTWGTFILFSNDIIVRQGDGRYAIELVGKTKGVAALFSPGRVGLASEGQWSDAGPEPRLFNNTGRWDGKSYRRTMFYDAGGQFIARTEDWPKKWQTKYQREPVPAAMQGGADPMSLLMHAMKPQDYAKTAKEPLTFRAFDGRRVVDYTIQCDAELDTLKKSRFSIYAGPARACRVGFETVAGKLIITEELRKEFEKERKKEAKRAAKMKKKGKDDDDVEPDDNRVKLWVADPNGSGLEVPVRMAFKGGAGTIRVYLKAYERKPLKAPLLARILDPEMCKNPIDSDSVKLGDSSAYC